MEQFWFETRTAALGAAALMLAWMRWQRIISIFLELTKAYDYALRMFKMELVEKSHRREVAGMVEQLL